VARLHAQHDPTLDNLKYLCTNIEEHADSHTDSYDAVVASEVIEHVDSQEVFVSKCSTVCRVSGSVFMTTLSSTQLSWLVAIVGAEYVLGLLPRGTHDWNKFISPKDLSDLLSVYGCQTRLVHGMMYNPVTNTWHWSPDSSVNFALHSVKL